MRKSVLLVPFFILFILPALFIHLRPAVTPVPELLMCSGALARAAAAVGSDCSCGSVIFYLKNFILKSFVMLLYSYCVAHMVCTCIVDFK